MPEQNKAKKERNLKSQKKLGRAFANLALAKAQVKRNGHQTFATKKISGKQEIAKPNNNLQKWITKTAKNYQKDKNRTNPAAKRALLAIYKKPKLRAKKAFSLKFRHSGLCKFRKLNTL